MEKNFSFEPGYVPKMPRHALPKPYSPPRPDEAFARKHFKSEFLPLGFAEKAVNEWLLHPQNKFFLKRRERRLSMSDLDDFVGIDGKDIVKDKRKTRKQIRKERDGRERGFIFEEVTRTFLTQDGWFGKMESSVSSLYDDRMNGVDFILSLDGEGESIYIAVDCTVTDSVVNLQKKLARNEDNVRNGKLTSVKYYQSPYYDSEHVEEKKEHLKTLENIPGVVVAIPSEVLENICVLVKDVIDKKQGSHEKLSGDFHQLLFLMEIVSQLKSQCEIASNIRSVQVRKENGFSKEARSVGQDEAMQKTLTQALALIEKMIESKKKELGEEAFQKAQELFEQCGYDSLMNSKF